jgi:hypothetical protein
MEEWKKWIQEPSFIASMIHGFLVLWILILIGIHSWSEKSRRKFYFRQRKQSFRHTWNTYQIIILLLLLSISIGIHGLSHLGLEMVYNFHPLSYFYPKNK